MTTVVSFLLFVTSASAVSQWLRARRYEDLCERRLASSMQLAELLIYERALGTELQRRATARNYVRYTPPDQVLLDLLGSE